MGWVARLLRQPGVQVGLVAVTPWLVLYTRIYYLKPYYLTPFVPVWAAAMAFLRRRVFPGAGARGSRGALFGWVGGAMLFWRLFLLWRVRGVSGPDLSSL